MEFGKLPYVGNINFDLPSEDARTQATLDKSPANGFSLSIGAPAWAHKEWVGSIFPAGTAAKDYLHYYSRQFNSIELNTTHYRIPDKDQVIKWREETPESFLFCPKFPQIISHDLELQNAEALTFDFLENISHFGNRLGMSFIQLPPLFAKNRLPVLARYLRSLPKTQKFAVEFRHPSWFSAGQLIPGARDCLEASDIASVITDVAGRRDVCHTSITTDFVMVRFIGNSLHPTDYPRADRWCEKIEKWKTMGIRRIFFFVHQPDDINTPEMTSYIVKQLGENNNLPFKIWSAPPDIQTSLF